MVRAARGPVIDVFSRRCRGFGRGVSSKAGPCARTNKRPQEAGADRAEPRTPPHPPEAAAPAGRSVVPGRARTAGDDGTLIPPGSPYSRDPVRTPSARSGHERRDPRRGSHGCYVGRSEPLRSLFGFKGDLLPLG